MQAGTILEGSTLDAGMVVDGTALFKVDCCYQPDAHGVFFAASFCGASSPQRAQELDAVFTTPGGMPPLLHLCVSHRSTCRQTVPGRHTLHVDLFRTRSPFGVLEPWARHGLLVAATPHLPAPLPAGQGPGLGPPGPADVLALEKKVSKLQEQLKRRGVPGQGLFEAALRGQKKKKKDSDDEETEEPLFQSAPSLSGANGVQVVARSLPGALFSRGVEEITRFLGEREGATGEDAADLPARTLAYLNSIFHGRHPPAEVGPRTCKEMRTLALAIDSLARGELPQVGDLLMQRFKALEMAVGDKSWAVASQLEVAEDLPGLTTMEEKQAAARYALLQQKLADAKAKAAAGAGRSG